MKNIQKLHEQISDSLFNDQGVPEHAKKPTPAGQMQGQGQPDRPTD